MRFGVDGAGRLGLRRHRSHRLEVVDACLLASRTVAEFHPAAQRFPGARDVECISGETGQLMVVVDGQQYSGPKWVVHHVAGRRFEISAGSFWQVHPNGAEALGRAVVGELGPRPGEHVVDLYAGVGLFAGLLGDMVGPTGKVLAVEADERATADARRNLSDQPQTEIRAAPVTAELVAGGIGSPDLVVLDPPRAGAGKTVTEALAVLRPRLLAYVACDPATFSRDLRVLVESGWDLVSLRAFDLFPMTEHVELLGVFRPPR
jgi:tRNA/tmRNA/rRNA uracil-C5-methylase (TrmA/RlmC/RlmD family)